MKSFLVVDDSRVVRAVSRRILEGMSFEVAEAADGAEALRWCREHMPDAVLVDLNMPVIDGFGFVRALRQLDGGARPTVIVCSVEKNLDGIREAIAAGADEYVMKPFDSEILRSKMTLAGIEFADAA